MGRRVERVLEMRRLKSAIRNTSEARRTECQAFRFELHNCFDCAKVLPVNSVPSISDTPRRIGKNNNSSSQ